MQAVLTRKVGWSDVKSGKKRCNKKAWTYAVLDAVEVADENTRLEIARILCPAGFEIVEIEVTRSARKH